MCWPTSGLAVGSQTSVVADARASFRRNTAAAAAGILVIRPPSSTSMPKNSESVPLLSAIWVSNGEAFLSDCAVPFHSPNVSCQGL